MLPKNINSKVSPLAANPFDQLGLQIRMEEMEETRDLHSEFDKTWKLLKNQRQKCRSLQYQFWAAVLIENDDELENLIESILIDPRTGNQHIASMPSHYRGKMREYIQKICIEDKSIKGNVNKFLIFLNKWHIDLTLEIKKQVGNNYIIKDTHGNNIINPAHRKQIKEIIKNNSEAKKIRDALNLSQRPLEEKEEKVLEPKAKTGMDYYIDYLLEDNEERAEELLSKAVKLGYVEDPSSDIKKPNAIISDDYYAKIFKELYEQNNYLLLEKIMLSGASKGSALAQGLLGEVYSNGLGHIKTDKKKSVKYYEAAAKNGLATAQHNLAGICFEKSDINRGIDLLKKAASQGLTTSQRILGDKYDRGNGVTQNNEEAIKWWQLAADLGDTTSKCLLGVNYIQIGWKSNLVDKDRIDRGMKLVAEAAEEGLAKAQFIIGYICINILKDFSKALKCLEAAAQQNNKDAINLLKEHKDHFDLIRIAEQNPKYYILLKDSQKDFDDRLINLTALLPDSFDFNNLYVKASFQELGKNESTKGYVLIPLPSNKLTKDVREKLGIDRTRIIANLTKEQQQALQLTLPKATIEDDPQDKSKTLVTWPLDARLDTKKIIGEFVKELKSAPSAIAEKPLSSSSLDTSIKKTSMEFKS